MTDELYQFLGFGNSPRTWKVTAEHPELDRQGIKAEWSRIESRLDHSTLKSIALQLVERGETGMSDPELVAKRESDLTAEIKRQVKDAHPGVIPKVVASLLYTYVVKDRLSEEIEKLKTIEAATSKSPKTQKEFRRKLEEQLGIAPQPTKAERTKQTAKEALSLWD